MVQILDALPAKYKRCGYMNATSCIQIIRIVNIPHWYFERVVFPQQRLLFETLPEAELEIYTREMVGAMLTDKIFCARLQITDEDITEINPDKLTLN
ncbi:MAG: DUF1830 domain-containing protein [Scytonema hyalinum WJT4-NPBG1]|nr:DUF1830 domain-containing protein [Scytonema hyalinum WJT4-NPBG1]